MPGRFCNLERGPAGLDAGPRTGQQFGMREQAGKEKRNGRGQNPETQHDTTLAQLEPADTGLMVGRV